MSEDIFKGSKNNEVLRIDYQTDSPILRLSNMDDFIHAVHACFENISFKQRKRRIYNLINSWNWNLQYVNKQTGSRVLSESTAIEYPHELKTAISLTDMNYDVIFAPSGMFDRTQKRFDVFLLSDSSIIKADLKSVSSKNSDTIERRIKDGSDQASYLVIDITSNIIKKTLIEGLRKGIVRNKLLQDIFLLYKGKLYRLSKSLVMHENIYKILK